MLLIFKRYNYTYIACKQIFALLNHSESDTYTKVFWSALQFYWIKSSAFYGVGRAANTNRVNHHGLFWAHSPLKGSRNCSVLQKSRDHRTSYLNSYRTGRLLTDLPYAVCFVNSMNKSYRKVNFPFQYHLWMHFSVQEKDYRSHIFHRYLANNSKYFPNLIIKPDPYT